MARLTLRQLTLFWNGQLGTTAHIADLSLSIGRHIGAQTTEVHIGLDYARKLRAKHRLLREHYHMIQLAIRYGAYALDRGDLLFHYTDREIWQKDFKLVIKAADGGHQLWVKTFHKLEPHHVDQIRKRLNILREQIQ